MGRRGTLWGFHEDETVKAAAIFLAPVHGVLGMTEVGLDV